MLSILMPVYNERERVEQAITEVLATKLPTDFELIVVAPVTTLPWVLFSDPVE